MLDCVNDKDAGLFVLQGCWMECLTRFQIECSTGMTEGLGGLLTLGFGRVAGGGIRQGCLFQCLTWILNVMFGQGCWIVCMKRMLD